MRVEGSRCVLAIDKLINGTSISTPLTAECECWADTLTGRFPLYNQSSRACYRPIQPREWTMHESFDKPEELGPNQGKEYQASNFHADEDDVPVDDIMPRQTRPPLSAARGADRPFAAI